MAWISADPAHRCPIKAPIKRILPGRWMRRAAFNCRVITRRLAAIGRSRVLAPPSAPGSGTSGAAAREAGGSAAQ
jgi:hypothetical protein